MAGRHIFLDRYDCLLVTGFGFFGDFRVITKRGLPMAGNPKLICQLKTDPFIPSGCRKGHWNCNLLAAQSTTPAKGTRI